MFTQWGTRSPHDPDTPATGANVESPAEAKRSRGGAQHLDSTGIAAAPPPAFPQIFPNTPTIYCRRDTLPACTRGREAECWAAREASTMNITILTGTMIAEMNWDVDMISRTMPRGSPR